MVAALKRQSVLQLAGLAAEAAAGVADVAGSMHDRIHAVTPLAVVPATSKIHKMIYRTVQESFLLAAGLARGVSEPHEWQERVHEIGLQPALQGVVGDYLAETQHPAHRDMMLVNAQGEPMIPEPGGKIAILLHGLCMDEAAFSDPGWGTLTDTFAPSGWISLRVRYNSGLSIAENGRQLAHILAQLAPDQLVLVGHSMGGLVMRSAYAQAGAELWLAALRLAVYMGTPHWGAPLEQLGEWANRWLGVTPWSAPLMRLGAVRSQGIQDLRCGDVGHDQLDLPPAAHHLLVGGELSWARRWPLSDLVGDGLVSLRSALAQDISATRLLRAPHLYRLSLPGRGHLALLSDPEVHEEIRQFWGRIAV